MTTEGKPLGWTARDEREHFIRCPVCSKMLDMRDLGEVIDHLHYCNQEGVWPGRSASVLPKAR